MDSQTQSSSVLVGPGGCSTPVWPEPIWLPSFEDSAWMPADHGLHVLRTIENTVFKQSRPTTQYS